jgi:hypothetical protein
MRLVAIDDRSLSRSCDGQEPTSGTNVLQRRGVVTLDKIYKEAVKVHQLAKPSILVGEQERAADAQVTPRWGGTPH